MGGFAATETIETLEEIEKMTLDFLRGKTSILRIDKKNGIEFNLIKNINEMLLFMTNNAPRRNQVLTISSLILQTL
ncbi:hypothetical protein [Desulfosporosinus sp. OT]|uniref:hypothetical protein n=1 Tax=Desulfosporosinus sp. OT TaxID=913865 RepID=UPI00058DE08D|nr:hypothetical protein [Desulfosporosinus sp. OT]